MTTTRKPALATVRRADEPGGWIVVCERHHATVAVRSRSLARIHAAEPESFCAACRGAIEVTLPLPTPAPAPAPTPAPTPAPALSDVATAARLDTVTITKARYVAMLRAVAELAALREQGLQRTALWKRYRPWRQAEFAMWAAERFQADLTAGREMQTAQRARNARKDGGK